MGNDNLSVEYQGRLNRTFSEMEEKGLDLLLVYSRGKPEMLRMDGVRYLTGYSGPGKEALLILDRNASPIVLVNPPDVIEIAKDEVVLADLAGAEDLAPGLFSVLGINGTSNRRIGLAGQDVMSQRLFQTISEQVPVLSIENDLLRRVGRTKTPWEIERIRRAQHIADTGFTQAIQQIRPGMREFELAAEIEFALRIQGAGDNFGLVASSHHNQAIRPPTARKLETGDIIIAEISPECDGYFAQLCRTVILGEPSRILLEKYELLKRGFEEGLHMAKPGTPAEDVAAAINAVMSEAGYAEFSKPPYMRSRGHGLGQGSNYPGELAEGNRVALEEGMTFIIHPNQYIPETGYLMLGETCVVSKTGAETLSSSEQKVFIMENV